MSGQRGRIAATEQPSPLGALLVQTRRRAELTQEKLAEQSGVSVNTIGNLEAGRGHLPRQATLDLLVNALSSVLALNPPEQRDLRAAFREAIGASFAPRQPSGLDAPAASRAVPIAPTLPGGTLTFLICLLVPTSSNQSDDAQALRTIVPPLAALLQHVVPRHGGHMVDPPDGPDGAVCVFPGAADAMSAAHAIEQALWDRGIAAIHTPSRRYPASVYPPAGVARRDAPDHPLVDGLPAPSAADESVGAPPVCLALHTGWTESGAGDYAGPTRQRAVRLARLGHAGQLLLTHSTRNAIQGSLPAGVQLQRVGQQSLSAVERPQPLYQILPSLRPAAFPPPRTLPAPSSNLPVQLTSFIGREREQAAVSALLGQVPLVTLLGAGGCGKTRLALQVAADRLEDYPDGVWLVELAALADPTLVPQALATVLGLREELVQPLLATLSAHLRARRLLLVLDNCEQVLTACAELVGALLRACPQLHVLATSRERLGIGGEVSYRVPSLSLPTPRQQPAAAALLAYAGVQLFVERARAGQPDFALSDENAGEVLQICARLDGMPLAIELAAARVGSLPLAAIAARLEQSLGVLTEGPRDAAPRQQTLRATLDWSWALLGEPEQLLLRRLAVFVGGWMVEAAEAVCGGRGLAGESTLGLLGSLVSKSLVELQESGGEGRYRLLETVRQYVAERLAASEQEAVQLRDTHLHYYAALFASSRHELTGPHQAAWMARLDDELNNVRAALAWARQSGQAAVGLRLTADLNKYWDRKNYQREGRAWLESLLALPGAAELPERAWAIQALGSLAYRQGDHDVAAQWLEQSISLYRGLGDEDGALGAASTLANVYLTQGQFDRATALYEETLAVFRARNRRWNIASSLNNLGEAFHAQGAFARAAASYEESLAIYREIGDLWSMASVLDNLGMLAARQGDLDRAEALALESLAMNRQLGDRHSTASIHLTLGTVAARRADPETARAHYLESLTIHRQRGYRGGIAASLEGLAAVAAARQPDLAVRLFGAAEALRAADGEPMPPAERAAYEAGVAQARSALTPAAFTAAWAAGQALPLEQAIALALA
jgi:predicted ATPase/transcriptional regulator with XRE-family HTH domain